MLNIVALAQVASVAGHAYLDSPASRAKLGCPSMNGLFCMDDRETTFAGGKPGANPGSYTAADPFCVAPKELFGAGTAAAGVLSPEIYNKLNNPGDVQATWQAGDTVEIKWTLVLPHGGQYSYHLCMDGSDNWDCFKQTPLYFADTGKEWKTMSMMPGPRTDRVTIPNVQCDRCTLAWRWDATQEASVFVNCADVSIGGGSDTPPQPAPAPGPTLPPMPAQPIYNPYMVLSNHDNGKCLDLLGGEASPGSSIGIWDCNGQESQRWWFQDGKIMLASDNSKCIDAPSEGEYGEVISGAKLQLWDCNGNSNQYWGVDSDLRTIYLASSKDASLCMDLSGGDASAGNLVQVWDCNGMSQQQFYVPPAFGRFNINSGLDGWKCLDVPGQSAQNGQRLQIWDCNGVMGQQFIWGEDDKIHYMDDYSKCVDVPGGEANEYGLLWLWDCNDSPGQVLGYDWNMQTIYFANSQDASMCWSLVSSDTSNGNAIQVTQCDGNDSSQHWGVGSGMAATLRTAQRDIVA